VSYLETVKPLTLADFARMRAAGERIAVLTCYDATFAALLDRTGVEILLVGDSLGNVVQGQASTLPVSLEHMAYHTSCVVRGRLKAFVMADLPFGSYQESPSQAMRSAARLMAAGAQCVKLEGGAPMAETVRFLVERGVPVCGHIGLTPQAVHQLGGYRVQGRSASAAEGLKRDALALEDAGAAFLVMEMVPATLSNEITDSLRRCATIGIGAGPGCSGQVLVLHDMLGVTSGKLPRFVKNFMIGAASVEDAVKAYVAAIKDGSFPGAEHGY
jgi:3-methyl-2-oxobutanoate hydroxymethyltransferase